MMHCLLYLAYFALGPAALAADWHTEAGHRWKALAVAPSRASGFTLQSPAETGVTFQNELDLKQGAQSRVLYNGSGVALGDVDGDGLTDIYFPSLQGRNTLFKNLGGGKFSDITADAGVACDSEISRGAVLADVDGNGTLDLLVSTTGQGVRVFLNDGGGKFTDATKSAGSQTKFGSTTLALADIDGNGTLDLYVANNRVEDIRDRGQAHLIMVQGKLTVPTWLKSRFVIDEENGAVLEMGEPDAFYSNDGAGHFTPLSWTGGAFRDEDGRPLSGPPRDWGLTATFRDLNADGAPDVYVCNDYWTPDRIWMNDGQGGFRAAPRLAIRHISASSMGVDFGDLTRQGRVDGFVVDMLSRDHRLRQRQATAQMPLPLPVGAVDNRPQVMRNTLLHQRSDGTFAELADFAGVAASEWAWQPLLFDVDLDGYEDVVISAGHIRDVQDLDASAKIDELKRAETLVPQTFSLESSGRKTRQEQFTAELYQGMLHYPPLDAPLVAYRNRGGLRFEETTDAWGLNTPGVHHGIASADLDGDGDLDLVVNNLNAVAGIYGNECSAPRVAVRLKGRAPNTQGIGAKVTLRGGAVPRQSSEVVSGGRYLSGCDPLLVFAAGKATRGMSIEVVWRDGMLTTVQEVGANRLYEIDQAAARTPPPKVPEPGPTPLFADATAQLGHTHHENDYDDFARGPLLPNRLSRLGPGVAWHDINADSHADLIIGSGQGGRVSVLLGDGEAGFTPLASEALGGPLERDISGLLAWTSEPGKAVLLGGMANFEDGDLAAPAVGLWNFAAARAEAGDVLPPGGASTGPLALANLEGLGELTLFVGGRVIAGKYPAPGPSQIFRFRAGGFVLDEKASKPFVSLGLVSGATFSDVNGDGFPDLVVALEWGPMRVFLNRRGELHDATAELGLWKFSGWWNGVAAGDFDEDGRMDLLATNWGLNSKYEHRYDAAHPLQIRYGDFNKDGTTQSIECYFERTLGKVVPERGLATLSAVMPWLRELLPTHAAFSTAGIDQILNAIPATSVSATTLSHTLFLNRGNRFESVSLSAEAQWAPAFGVTVADFDGDGHEDAFLAQNHFSAQPFTPRLDAGRGLLLRGDGKGGLAPMPAEQSGIAVHGEMRGCASADYDSDGRTDLVVTQNGAATRLFHNTRAQPGLRVRLSGPPGNLDGLGAQVRLIFPKRRGPIREIRAGSGYWSQDSAVPVLGTPSAPTAVWVRWPGGRVVTTKVPSASTEITVGAE